MILDCHIHIRDAAGDRDAFVKKMAEVGVGGGVVISRPPASYLTGPGGQPPQERLDNVLWWCAADAELYPFLWIDPLADDAEAQVDLAVRKGVAGFKIICDRFMPGEPRAMETYRAIASRGKPILFHSGILWDNKPSGLFNRPAGFECLLEVSGLRFCLAHISWPWCDELIAVYGKFLVARRRRAELSCEMFVDITPGTPPIYRCDALTKLFTTGYDVARNVLFGSDCSTNEYSVGSVAQWLERDGKIFTELGLPAETLKGVYCDNLRRFIGNTR
jgi:predicted TIM-barrel fold metal-dependent hydrolase